MYDDFPPINLNIVREFYGNFSDDNQTHLFLRGQRIRFSEEDICRYLGIPYELPPLGKDDIFKATVQDEKSGNLNMDAVIQLIRKEGMNWANNPEDNTITRRSDNVILNTRVTAWHKLIMENIDPKTHGTTFLLERVLLIYVLMTESVVNLPQIMWDVMLKCPTGNSRHLIPYPISVSRLANYIGTTSSTSRAASTFPTSPAIDNHNATPICHYREFTRAFTEGCYEIPAQAGSPLTQIGPPAAKHADHHPAGIPEHGVHRFSAGFFCGGW
ncbi:hypothetical protein PIB30_070501 [Stylosanthes scabra]|uniref:Putative plant transposon protein domain-containing protein n=1 Tax=Stylosanthes scabra TaxID=79078 RepID=A0ABU6UMZ9_9FABA|nr:hypothetical protein [Stylosanthes scabra]